MKKFKPVYILSKDNIANLLPKALSYDTTQNFILDLGLYNGNKREEKEADDLKVIVRP